MAYSVWKTSEGVCMALAERAVGHKPYAALAELLARHGFGPKLLLVCDDVTWIAAGPASVAGIGEAYQVTTHSLGRDVRASVAHAKEVVAAAAGFDGLIAVGSGTVNDVTKYAAAVLDKPYLCVATAASMNGYTSANASLEVDGHKQSFPAQPPRAVVVDLDVIAHAPRRLSRSGLGDTLCRSTVEADMLLSHFLFGAPYPKPLFDTLRKHEHELTAHAGKLTANDTDYDASFIRVLIEALLDAGDAMTTHGSSAVASQGEHMIAHTAELMYGTDLHRVSHGELVAVATLTMANLQQQMLLAQPIVKPLPRGSSLFLRVFGKHSADALEAAYKKKMVTPDQAIALTDKLAQGWPELKQQLSDVMLSASTIQRAFVLSATPNRPHDVKLEPERYQNAVTYAHMSRDRFTFLDLAAMNDKRV